MIINIHPKEIESKTGKAIIDQLAKETNEKIVFINDKTATEWQEIVKSDEKLIFVGPIYWWGLGYEFEKWTQDVLTYGYAYKYEDGSKICLLNDREFEVHLTHGTPSDYANVMKNNISERLEKGIFGFCGAKVKVIFHEQVR